MKEHLYLPSSDGKTRLHTVIWEPAGQVWAIVQISHGMVEYVERYEAFAKFLNQYGILVAGHDHLGHGDSVRSKLDRGYFAKGYGDVYALQDLHRVTIALRKKYPYIPHFLFGHSMGSFLARRYLSVYSYEIEGAIICGTGWQPKPVLAAGRVLTKLLTMLFGDRHRSKFITGLAFGNINRGIHPLRTPKDWLNRDAREVNAYIADPKCGFLFTLNGYAALFRAMALSENILELAKMDRNMPVLLVAGEADPVGNFGKGVKRTARAFGRMGMRDVECILYPGMRHEILNEIDKETVYTDIVEWIEKRI